MRWCRRPGSRPWLNIVASDIPEPFVSVSMSVYMRRHLLVGMRRDDAIVRIRTRSCPIGQLFRGFGSDPTEDLRDELHLFLMLMFAQVVGEVSVACLVRVKADSQPHLRLLNKLVSFAPLLHGWVHHEPVGL